MNRFHPIPFDMGRFWNLRPGDNETKASLKTVPEVTSLDGGYEAFHYKRPAAYLNKGGLLQPPPKRDV